MKLMQATLMLALTPLCNALDLSKEVEAFNSISDVVFDHFKTLSDDGDLDEKIFKVGDYVEFKDFTHKTVRVGATDPLFEASDNDGNTYDFAAILENRYFQVGDRVRVQTNAGEQKGTVKDLSLGVWKLQVRIDGETEDEVFSKDFVKREFKIGDHVHISRGLPSDPWTVGHVTSLAPFHLQDHYGVKRKGFWNKVDRDSIIRAGDEVQLIANFDLVQHVRGEVVFTHPLKAIDEYGHAQGFEDIHKVFKMNYQIGDLVRVRQHDDDEWQNGTVEILSPLKVRTADTDSAIWWSQVSRRWENMFHLMVDLAIRYPDLHNDHETLESTLSNEKKAYQALEAKYTQEANDRADEKTTLEKEINALTVKHTEEKTTLEAKYTQEANDRADEKATLEKEINALTVKHTEEKTTLEAKHTEEKTTLEKESEKTRKLMIAFSVLFSLCAVAVIALSVLLVLKAKKTQSNSDNQAMA